MNRRDILKHSTIFAGAALSAGTISAILSGCQSEATVADIKGSGLSQAQLDLIADVAERIIPKTDTPGAKDAKVHEFIDEQIALNFTDEESSMFANGLELFDVKSDDAYGQAFTKLTDEEKDNVLTAVVDDFKAITDDTPHIWPAIKGLVVTGFFTSEVGATEALVYDPIPGEWIGCIDLSEVGGLYAL
jgi:hypothetical protein